MKQSKVTSNRFYENRESALSRLAGIGPFVVADYVDLSYAAKVFWLTKGQSANEQEIRSKAETTGWRLDDVQIAEATGFLKKIQKKGFQPASV